MGQQAPRASKRVLAIAKAMRAFAAIYNDHKSYTLMHDLLRGLYPDDSIKDKRRTLVRRIKKYSEFRKAHPDLGLPHLILRQMTKDGNMIAIPDGVMEQLDAYRIDPAKIAKAKGLIVTSAQIGTSVNKSVWDAFKRYAECMEYVLVVMPIKYGRIKTVHQKETDKRVLTSTYDEVFKGHMVFEDTLVAGGALNLNVMRLRPTLMKFINATIAQRGYNVSQIFGSPKLELLHTNRMQHDYPKAAMTTGAVTHPSYNVDNVGQQDRTGAIAAAEHTFAAIVIEFSAKKTFHYRQLLSTKEGEFYDIDPVRGGAVFVTPDKVEHRPDDVVAAYLGDYHAGVTHLDVRHVTFGDGQMLQTLKPKHAILGDLMNGHSISHWDKENASRRAFKGAMKACSLKEELALVKNELEYMHRQMPGTVLDILASNHNEFLKRYIQTLRWMHDDNNLAFAARLFADLHDDMVARGLSAEEAEAVDTLNFWLNKQGLPYVKTFERQDMLLLPENDDAVKIACNFHGDVGPSGARASMEAMREWNQWSIIGHNHSAAILGPIWRVGTMTKLTEHYVNGPRTKWTHTHALVFRNGQRMLINIVNGAWHGQSKQRPKSAGIGSATRSRKPTKASRKATRAACKPATKRRASKRAT